MPAPRKILPAQPGQSPQTTTVVEDFDTAPQPSSASKRRPQTRIACAHCRRKKSKCDGGRPVCGACANAGLNECEYDGNPDLTRTAALRKKHDELQQRADLLEELFQLLYSRSEDESLDIIRCMRSARHDTDLAGLIRFIKDGDLLVQLSVAGGEGGGAENDAEEPVERVDKLSPDEMAVWLATINARVSKLDLESRETFLNVLKTRVDELTSTDLRDGLDQHTVSFSGPAPSRALPREPEPEDR